MTKVLLVFGTRPEAIKMAPVIRALEGDADRFQKVVCLTAQHRHLLDQVLEIFRIRADYDLDLMRANQSPLQVASAVMSGLEPILAAERPDWLLVQGDTTTVMAAAISGFYHRIKVGHIEAGLRTNDRFQPFPEEVNRRIASVVTELHFAPTAQARRNLLVENVPEGSILVTGNTVIDALQWASELPYSPVGGPLEAVPWDKQVILVTAHRRENFGAPLESICQAVRRLAEEYREGVHFLFPVHPNPNVMSVVQSALGSAPNVTLTAPLEYLALVHALKLCRFVMTDSGGLQEEAPGLGKPVLVLRNTTERPEAVDAGTAILVGTETSPIMEHARLLITDSAVYSRMASATNPFGDGKAAQRIVEALE